MKIPDVPPRKYQLGPATLYRGDVATVLERRIRPGSVDLIIADPPYNLGKRFGPLRERWPDDAAYAAWCREWLDLCVDRLTPHGSMYLMASTQGMPALDLYLRTRVHVLSRIVWCYDSSGVQAKRRFGSLYEPILHCVKDKRRYTFNADAIRVEARTGAVRRLIDHRKPIPAPYSASKVPGNVWSFPRVRYMMPEYRDHPTQKPEALVERMIRASSNPGDMVLDLFAGTFTASVVACRLGRRSVGVELHDGYVAIGRHRLREDAGPRTRARATDPRPPPGPA